VWLEVRETRIVLPDEVYADVNPLTAPVGDLFVIQQHHATALHHDFRLEMSNGDEPVLVSWAVPKGLPRRRGQRHLAIRTPDHSMDHAEFTGTIPNDEYGGGVVRMFDRGPYEMVGRTHDRLTFRLDGDRLKGVWHLVLTGVDKGKEQWLAMMSQDLRPEEEELPNLEPMLTTPTAKAFDDPNFWFEPHWAGLRVLASCSEETRLVSNGVDITDRFPELERLHNQVVALNAVLDGEIVAFDDGVPSASRLRQRLDEDDRRIAVAYLAYDLIYLDGSDLTEIPLEERRRRLEETVVLTDRVQVSPITEGDGVALFEAVTAQGISGIVAKRRTSIYEPGAQSADWLEVSTRGD
jgi:bifunctional non-homologous end joining protein LigD